MSFAVFSEYFVNEFPEGQFEGIGEWVDNAGNGGPYNVAIGIFDNQLAAHYEWPEGTLDYVLTFVFTAPGEFDVLIAGAPVGNGECGLNYCDYAFEIDGAEIDEAIDFVYAPDGRPMLVKSGEKHLGDETIAWEEEAFLLNHTNGDTPFPIVTPDPEPAL